MQRYFKALLGEDIRFLFPRLWNTKGETLAAFAKITDERAHVDARSCWQQSRQVSVDHRRRQCGVCAACMLRRLSVHAAGLQEPRDTYVWEDLEAPEFERGAAKNFKKITRALREYAIAGTLHLDHLAALRKSPSHKEALKRRAHQLAKSQGLSPEEAETKLDRLLARLDAELVVEALGRDLPQVLLGQDGYFSPDLGIVEPLQVELRHPFPEERRAHCALDRNALSYAMNSLDLRL